MARLHGMSPPTLDAALRRNARERPSAIACVLVPDAREKDRKCFFTWDELHGVVDALARVLRADRRPRVLSFCRDGVEAFVALHACARARKSLVNVDAATPASRIRDVARDANATTCLCANDGDEDSVQAVLGESRCRGARVGGDERGRGGDRGGRGRDARGRRNLDCVHERDDGKVQGRRGDASTRDGVRAGEV